MTPDKTTLDACLKLLRENWPNLDELPEGVANLTLNQIERVLEREGLEAITPERIEGWREIAEGYLTPFSEASKIAEARQNASARPPAPGPSEDAMMKVCFEVLKDVWPEFTRLPDVEAERAFLWALSVFQEEGAAAITQARIRSWQESLQRVEDGKDTGQE
jgi:hypothetical protein